MNSLLLPNEVINTIKKLLKSDVLYVTLCHWLVLQSSNKQKDDQLPKVYKSYIILCEESLHLVDERFDKVFASIKYLNISKVLIDMNHEQCFQILFNYAQDTHAKSTLEQQVFKNSVLDASIFQSPPIIFTQARLNFLNHLSMSWKTDYMIKNFQVKSLEIFRYDIMKLKYVKAGKSKAYQLQNEGIQSLYQKSSGMQLVSQNAILNKLNEFLPPSSDVAAVGGNDLWTLKFHNSYLIENMIFQIDKSFRRTGMNDFHHKISKNLRIHIEVNKPIPLIYLKEIRQRQNLQAYAELIFQKTIIKDLEEHGEINEYTILQSRSYCKRHNISVKQNFSKSDGWIIQVRTVYRDIFLIIIRESYLPPACAFFQEYFMIIYGDHEGEYDDIQLSQGIIKPYQLLQLITTVIDNSRFTHHMEQSYQEAIIQQSLDSLLFQSFDDYHHLSTHCKFISQFTVFGIPFIISILQNMKYRSSKDEQIFEEMQRQYYQPTLKELLSKYKELIEQLDGKLTPFEMVEKFLQRSMFVNNLETRLNWLKKLQFFMAYCIDQAITPRMKFLNLLESLYDDEDYFSRLISFMLCLREKQIEQQGEMDERNGNLISGNSQPSMNYAGQKKNELFLIKHQTNFQFDLQNFSEQPQSYEFNIEIMHIIISSQSLLDIFFLSNQPQVITKIYKYFLRTDCEYYNLQIASVQSIYQYCIDKRPTEMRLQLFKGFIYDLLKICEKADQRLVKLCFVTIYQIILCDENLALLPQFELLKQDGPHILVNSLSIIDQEQIQIILKLVKLLINSLDIFIKLGITKKLVQLIYILEEIEGISVQENTLIQIESLLLQIVRKNEISQLKNSQKKTIFNLMKSTNSNSPEHMLKVMELVQEITKKDVTSKKQLGVFIVNKILNLLYIIDKKQSYSKVYQICLEILINYIQENLIIKNKLQKENALKGILTLKLKQISQQELEINENNIDTLNGQIVALCEELYDININNQEGGENISPIMPKKTITELMEEMNNPKRKAQISIPELKGDQNQQSNDDDDDLESVYTPHRQKDNELSEKVFSPLHTEEEGDLKQMDFDKKQKLVQQALSKFKL
ncbi:hypothetical protein TTHERM_00703790 (macronuclear) [Tetrahymena thermophila SB210]|uniref:Uncharacterized protein n=1 Tax=Tetrahymena thermophila (strain SB210) TaxID=312017 RepID=Q22GE4_TETTS|nr:hypothetical protein TTHERM_00703790 [Tetrahymena thermophila SB210]EAR84387.2 hypothetical protein TTHERM_00703790 [Tetrahymena thermophila SB210]|eukprot:XP_001032050.2 hypothetical protein TTHERM_00703790 [Tetrahymena thermophila SB210]